MSNPLPPEAQDDNFARHQPDKPFDDKTTPDTDAQFQEQTQNKQWATEPNSPSERLKDIQAKIERTTSEFANREISRSQFNAIYSHYNEQRAIIERIINHDPSNPGWKQASRSGKTQFLRQHFEARPVNYVIYIHHEPRPIMGNGTKPDLIRIASLLQTLWKMEKKRVGVARIELKEPHWLVMVAGQYSVTFVTYSLEPSGLQVNQTRDLHNDFERANRLFLERNRINKAQMVFPQRALLENKLG